MHVRDNQVRRRSLREVARVIDGGAGAKVESQGTMPTSQDLLNDPLYAAIISSSQFERLAGIAFLGGISYFLNIGLNESRADHTLRVARLVLTGCRRLGVGVQSERLLVSSALLHDIHHLPFSHTLDAALRSKVPEFSYETLTRRLLKSKPSSGVRLTDILSDFGVQIESLIYFRKRGPRSPFLASTHNADTLDGITRSARLLRGRDGVGQGELALRVIGRICEAGTGKVLEGDEIAELDEFWDLKNCVYAQGIYHPAVLISERVLGLVILEKLGKAFRTHELSYLRDRDLISAVPELLSLPRDIWNFVNSAIVPHTPLLGVEKGTQKSGWIGIDNMRSIREPMHTLEINTRRFYIDRLHRKITKSLMSYKARYRVAPLTVVTTIQAKALRELKEVCGTSLSAEDIVTFARTRTDTFL